MKTAGTLLKEARESRHLSLEELAQITKIREEYLRAIEQNEYDGLPSGPFVRGFLRTYAAEVGVNPETVVAVYRRDFGKQEKEGLIPKGLLNPLRRKNRVLISPMVFGILVLALVVVGFIVYQWRVFTQPPRLSLIEPKENQQVHSPVLLRGETTSDAVVFVNQNPISTDQDGKFTTQIELSSGEQVITVEASTRRGKNSILRRTVRVIE